MADVPAFSNDGTRSTKYERILAVRSDALPDSFRRNSLKESLVLEYVEHFRKQFVQLYPDRPPLLLAPLNEAGVPKFVPTTIRPTQLPFRDLYDVGACATFFAAYLHYEPLDNPIEVPLYLPSPSFTLQTRVGDSFDLATVLASYLIGSGYDAFVVSGRAPRWITLRMEDRSICEWKPPSDAVNRELHALASTLETLAPVPSPAAAVSEPAGASRYRLLSPPSLDSEYARMLADKAAATKHAGGIKADVPTPSQREWESKLEMLQLRNDTVADDAVYAHHSSALHAAPLDTALPADPLHGLRVHAWVLVRAGRRELSSHIFVEPSTGAIYPVTDSPYLAVESLWNHCNYYVNMQNQPLIPRQQLTSPKVVEGSRKDADATISRDGAPSTFSSGIGSGDTRAHRTATEVGTFSLHGGCECGVLVCKRCVCVCVCVCVCGVGGGGGGGGGPRGVGGLGTPAPR
jgi:hypothetical protein